MLGRAAKVFFSVAFSLTAGAKRCCRCRYFFTEDLSEAGMGLGATFQLQKRKLRFRGCCGFFDFQFLRRPVLRLAKRARDLREPRSFQGWTTLYGWLGACSKDEVAHWRRSATAPRPFKTENGCRVQGAG